MHEGLKNNVRFSSVVIPRLFVFNQDVADHKHVKKNVFQGSFLDKRNPL